MYKCKVMSLLVGDEEFSVDSIRGKDEVLKPWKEIFTIGTFKYIFFLLSHYKKTGLSQRFQNRWDSPRKRWDRVKIPIPAFFFPALQTAAQ